MKLFFFTIYFHYLKQLLICSIKDGAIIYKYRFTVGHFQPLPDTYTWRALAFKWPSILNVGNSL